VISEGFAWIGPFLDNLTVARLNRDSIGLKGGVSVLLSKRPMRRPFLAQVDSQVNIIENAVLTLQFPQNAALQKMRGQRLEPAPSIETTMRIDGKCREVAHVNLLAVVCFERSISFHSHTMSQMPSTSKAPVRLPWFLAGAPSFLKRPHAAMRAAGA